MSHQHKVSISTVVALVTAPVHKGVINDAAIAFNPIAGAPRANILAKIQRAREAMAKQSVNEWSFVNHYSSAAPTMNAAAQPGPYRLTN